MATFLWFLNDAFVTSCTAGRTVAIPAVGPSLLLYSSCFLGAQAWLRLSKSGLPKYNCVPSDFLFILAVVNTSLMNKPSRSVFCGSTRGLVLMVYLFLHQIICNGPGTCVPIVLMAFMLAVLGFKKTTVVYVESFCRVRTLSLTGRILYHLADHFVVQWPQLTTKYPRAKYQGLLV